MQAARSGAKLAMGRTFFWDGGNTDQNFNRLNAHLFGRLCANPEADERQALADAARDMFGANLSPELIQIFWETEPVVRSVIGINGVDPLNHSRFPTGEYLDIVYTKPNEGMKSVSDLFQPAGTKLYPPLTGDLRNLQQWRWQNRAVSKDPRVYLEEKRAAAIWTTATLGRIENLSKPLSLNHRELVVRGYTTLDTLARGMEIFVEAAALHYSWAHAKLMDDDSARTGFEALAGRIRATAETCPGNALGCRERMLEFAAFLETDFPRLHKCS